jgi:hypothetical protein
MHLFSGVLYREPGGFLRMSGTIAQKQQEQKGKGLTVIHVQFTSEQCLL